MCAQGDCFAWSYADLLVKEAQEVLSCLHVRAHEISLFF